MKIDPSKIAQLANNYNKNSKQDKMRTEGKDKSDKVDVSSKALQIQNAKAVYDELPDVRTEKVAELKEQIKTDNYNVSGEEIAGAMLDSVIDQKV